MEVLSWVGDGLEQRVQSANIVGVAPLLQPSTELRKLDVTSS
jgi:hypothetical protein